MKTIMSNEIDANPNIFEYIQRFKNPLHYINTVIQDLEMKRKQHLTAITYLKEEINLARQIARQLRG